MASKKEIITALEESHNQMIDLLNVIDVEKEVYSGWTIKEVLAHIAGWDEAAVASVSSLIQGGTPDVVAIDGADVYNAQSVAKRKALSLDETFADWEKERENLIATLSAVPDNQLSDDINFPWGGDGSVADIGLGLAGHENYHIQDIKEKISD